VLRRELVAEEKARQEKARLAKANKK